MGLLLLALACAPVGCSDDAGRAGDARLTFLDRGVQRRDSRAGVVADGRPALADGRAVVDRSVARDATVVPAAGDAGCDDAGGSCARCVKDGDCPDALGCTTDTCNAQGRCVHTNTCEFGRWCTSSGCVACDASHACAGGGRCVGGFCWDTTCAASLPCDETVSCEAMCTVEGGTKYCRKLGAGAYAWVTEAQLACGSAGQPVGATYQCQGKTHVCCTNGEWGYPNCAGCARTRACTATTPCDEACSLDGDSKSCRKVNDRPWEWITYAECGSAMYPIGTLYQCSDTHGACCADRAWHGSACP